MKIATRFSVSLCSLLALFVFAVTNSGLAQDNDAITHFDSSTNHATHMQVTPRGHTNGMADARFGITNIDSLVNFNDRYDVQGFDSNGNPNFKWYTNTVGNPPQMGGSTVINAPIIPVSVDMRNTDGSVRYVSIKTGPVTTCDNANLTDDCHRLFFDVTPFIQPTLESPVFQVSQFSSSTDPTQITDAVQRAEYFRQAKANWHTLLNPSVKTTRTMVLKRGTYAFQLNDDGTCCQFVEIAGGAFVNALFPSGIPPFRPGTPDGNTPIGAAEFAGDITTKDISTFLFPATYLPSGPGFFTIGFHSYDFEPGDASNGNRERRYVVNYSSWIKPGFFRNPNFLDVTAMSHEIAETFNDPFVASDGIHNITPWWLSGGNCQNNLEDGDVVEGLPNATYPITMPNGTTYHPQNEALLQWFEFQSPSSALDGAYSYPNESTLTALSAPQKAGCQ
jgi:hypothetical protein